MSDSVIAKLDNDVMKMVEDAASVQSGHNAKARRKEKHGDPELCDNSDKSTNRPHERHTHK